MTHLRGTGPQNLLSSEAPRLSPIMKYIPAGTVMGTGKSQSPFEHHAKRANGSFWRTPLRTT
jgi:hypothetical protein